MYILDIMLLPFNRLQYSINIIFMYLKKFIKSLYYDNLFPWLELNLWYLWDMTIADEVFKSTIVTMLKDMKETALINNKKWKTSIRNYKTWN